MILLTKPNLSIWTVYTYNDTRKSSLERGFSYLGRKLIIDKLTHYDFSVANNSLFRTNMITKSISNIVYVFELRTSADKEFQRNGVEADS